MYSLIANMSLFPTKSMNLVKTKDALKHIQPKHKSLVFAYFRQNTTIFDQYTPEPIVNICLIYAFLITEYFKDFANPIGLIIGNNGTTFINASDHYQAAFGAVIIDCTCNNNNIAYIYTWKVHIGSICAEFGKEITIGIDEWYDDHRLKALYHYDSYNFHYAYGQDGTLFVDQFAFADNASYFALNEDEHKYSKDDIITMIVNTGIRSIDFYKNHKHVYKCKGIKKCLYRMAIFLDENTSVTLQSFTMAQQNLN